jgi:ferredoxin-NADP reductase
MNGSDLILPSGAIRSVIAVNHYTDSLFELVLERGELDFEPGDCLSLFEPSDLVSRPYSIASGTHEETLRFLIRRIQGGQVSSSLYRLKPGNCLRISEPFGWFRPGQSFAEPFVFIATGTGMAPFLSFYRSFPERSPRHCLWGVRRFEDAIHFDGVLANKNIRLAISREQKEPHFHGRVTELFNDLHETDWPHYYLCGSEGMITEITGILEQHGCPIGNIHREVFFYDRNDD